MIDDVTDLLADHLMEDSVVSEAEFHGEILFIVLKFPLDAVFSDDFPVTISQYEMSGAYCRYEDEEMRHASLDPWFGNAWEQGYEREEGEVFQHGNR